MLDYGVWEKVNVHWRAVRLIPLRFLKLKVVSGLGKYTVGPFTMTWKITYEKEMRSSRSVIHSFIAEKVQSRIANSIEMAPLPSL